MEIPIELFLGGIAVSIALAIFGFIRQPQIPAMLVFGGMFVLTFAVATDTIIMDSFATDVINSANIFAMDNPQGTTGMTLRTGGAEIRGQYVSSTSSVLIGKEIDCIEVYLGRTLSPSGTVTIGIIDGTSTIEANQLKQSFGTIDASALTTVIISHTFCLPTGQTYTIVHNDNLGAIYRGGDLSNNVQIRETNADTFDSSFSFERRWDDPTQTWISSSPNDVSMRAYLRSSDTSIITQAPYEFTELPKTLFALVGVICMLCGGLMVFKE